MAVVKESPFTIVDLEINEESITKKYSTKLVVSWELPLFSDLSCPLILPYFSKLFALEIQ